MSDQETAEPGATPVECQPCSGKGKVISNLGGTPSEITCPWCEGTGKFIPGHDAQAHWETETPPGESPANQADSDAPAANSSA